jgi:hypothetical protein
MQIVPGGFTKIEFDDSIYFLAPTEIKLPLKTGTNIQPATATEEFSDGTDCETLKKISINIRSADNDLGAGSAYERLTAAEENRTLLHFKFYLLNGMIFIVYNVRQIVRRELNEVGKFNSLNVYGLGVAESEEQLWKLQMIMNLYSIAQCNDVEPIGQQANNIFINVTVS